MTKHCYLFLTDNIPEVNKRKVINITVQLVPDVMRQDVHMEQVDRISKYQTIVTKIDRQVLNNKHVKGNSLIA